MPMDLDLEKHVRSSQPLKPIANIAPAHHGNTVSLSDLTHWKEEQLLSDTEFQATSSILQKVLRIKKESLLQSTTKPNPKRSTFANVPNGVPTVDAGVKRTEVSHVPLDSRSM